MTNNPRNSVKINPVALKTVQTLDQNQPTLLNTAGIFAKLVLNMNGDNITKINMVDMIKACQQRSQITGIKFDANHSLQSIVENSLKALENKKIIAPKQLPLKQGEFCFKVSPDMVQL